ncbi:unnamed protein product [Rotaria sp. Silwood1]|nr:unnamed protein product [Rotaria sp. Silwood1]CAF3842405.1 unnamed protein product [Rotaria sp. Silwood1]CAF5021958.1 unnamed protein product [Rotaria sp. Silwood1]
MVTSVFDSPMATSAEIITTNNDEFDEQLNILGGILQDIFIGDCRMTAIDFVDVNNDILTFNEWFDNCENIVTWDVNEEEEDDDSNYRTAYALPKLTEAIEMM